MCNAVKDFSIITVAVRPCWDITCSIDGIQWGQHKTISSQTIIPAGKALNISRALAWLGVSNTAAGLWGKNDYQQMRDELEPLDNLIKIKCTPTSGKTRLNITVVDSKNKRELHLRSPAEIADRQSLQLLKADLESLADCSSVFVFAGSLPELLIDDVIAIMLSLYERGAKIVLDTSGQALKAITESVPLWLVKPNIDELKEISGRDIPNKPAQIALLCQNLLEKIEILLVSRGPDGAVLISKNKSLSASAVLDAPIISTVGCGDYLLAGFLAGMKKSADYKAALKTAIRTATAKACGWIQNFDWQTVEKKIKVNLKEIQ